MGKKKGKKNSGDEGGLTRIAIVSDRCKPKKCKHECKRSCPVVRIGKLCIQVTAADKMSLISESLCVGCGICVKKCPFEAIQIINLPKNLERQTTHRYGANTFKLHRLPTPRTNNILGLVGTNGIGKSTALKILAGKLKPNLGRYDDPPDWEEILKYFRGSELQGYFTKILEDNLKAIIKPQYVDHIPRAVKGTVKGILSKKDEKGIMDQMVNEMELNQVLDRDIKALSGGELQRFAIGVVCVQDADVYMFDESSSYLDVRQRLQAAAVVRSLLNHKNYIIVVEHDLAVLDYLSDFVCCLYGVAGGYGVVTMPFSVREGINIFLAGFVPTENLRFRDTALTFKVSENADAENHEDSGNQQYNYPAMKKTFRDKKTKKAVFKMEMEAGSFSDSEIIVLLGENGTGKTTFIKMLAGKLSPDSSKVKVPELNVSFKPQTIAPKFNGTVAELFHRKLKDRFMHQQFQADVFKPMDVAKLMDQKVKHLSGGELQRVAIVLCLGTPADLYLLDEPSSFLDSSQRLTAAKVIKRFILHSKKTAFIVEHDFIMGTYMADRVVVYDGKPGVHTHAGAPQSLLSGMNQFLKQLDITFRRDPTNHRPRINKLNSQVDKAQKAKGTYFFSQADTSDEKELAKRRERKKKEEEKKK